MVKMIQELEEETSACGCGCCGPEAAAVEVVATEGESRKVRDTSTRSPLLEVCDCGCEGIGCDCGCLCCT